MVTLAHVIGVTAKNSSFESFYSMHIHFKMSVNKLTVTYEPCRPLLQRKESKSMTIACCNIVMSVWLL